MRSFGFESTTDDVLEGIDLTGRRILVTGASAAWAWRRPGRWPPVVPR